METSTQLVLPMVWQYIITITVVHHQYVIGAVCRAKEVLLGLTEQRSEPILETYQ